MITELELCTELLNLDVRKGPSTRSFFRQRVFEHGLMITNYFSMAISDHAETGGV